MDYEEKLFLSGEVVEVYEKNSFKFAKIRFNSGFIEIPFNDLHDVHLSDKVFINSRIKIESILYDFEDNINESHFV